MYSDKIFVLVTFRKMTPLSPGVFSISKFIYYIKIENSLKFQELLKKKEEKINPEDSD